MTEVQRVHEWKVWHFFFFFNKKNECLYKKLALISPQVTKGWQTSLRKLTTLITRLHNLFWRFTFLEIHPLPPPSPHGLPLQRQEARESGVRMHNMEMRQTDSYSVITASHIYNIYRRKSWAMVILLVLHIGTNLPRTVQLYWSITTYMGSKIQWRRGKWVYVSYNFHKVQLQ